MAKTKIYIAEYNEESSDHIDRLLTDLGYEVTIFDFGTDLLTELKMSIPNLIIINTLLPEQRSGIDICRLIRDDIRLKHTPIILLSERKNDIDEILGLEMGADDFIYKPFCERILQARIRALLRRSGIIENLVQNEEKKIVIGDIVIDSLYREVKIKGKSIDLTYKEFELLVLLVQNSGKVLTRDALLDRVWGYEFFGSTRTVDVHIKNLRKQIGDDEKELIETVRGIGYKFKK